MFVQEFSYTGTTKKITLQPDRVSSKWFPTPYLLECYGAQGNQGSGGNYTKGTILVRKPIDLYLSVGEAGGDGSPGWNSDGRGYDPYNNTYGYRCSGGSTDISLTGTNNSSNWNDSNRFNGIILRAQGGNGSSYAYTPYVNINFNQVSFDSNGEFSNHADKRTWGYLENVLNYTTPISGTIKFWCGTVYQGTPYARMQINGSSYTQTGHFNFTQWVNRNVTIKLDCGNNFSDYINGGTRSDFTWWYRFTPDYTYSTYCTGHIDGTTGTSDAPTVASIYIPYWSSGSNYVYFYSNNRTAGDPYGYADRYGGNDDGNGDLNFYIRYNSYGSYTHNFRCGSRNNNSPASYDYRISYPPTSVNNITRYSSGSRPIPNVTRTGGVNNYPNIIGNNLTDIGSAGGVRTGDGLIRITRTITPRNSNLIFDAKNLEHNFDYQHFTDFLGI